MAAGKPRRKPSDGPEKARRGKKQRRRLTKDGFKLTPEDPSAIVARVERGFSYAAVEKLKTELDVSFDRLAEVMCIKSRTLARRKAEGRLQPDESDRVYRFKRLVDLAVELFDGDKVAARRWMTTKKAALGGKTPLDFARSEVGAREVENLIGRLSHGVYS